MAPALGLPAPVHARQVRRPPGHAVPGRPARVPDEGRAGRLPRGVRGALRAARAHGRPRGSGAAASATGSSSRPARVAGRPRTWCWRRAATRCPGCPSSPAGSRHPCCSCTRATTGIPAQLRPGPVLVVGMGNSGAEIALDVSGTHATTIAGTPAGELPRAPRPCRGAVRAARRAVRGTARAHARDADRTARAAEARRPRRAADPHEARRPRRGRRRPGRAGGRRPRREAGHGGRHRARRGERHLVHGVPGRPDVGRPPGVRRGRDDACSTGASWTPSPAST